jgi:uncharacterized protein
MLGVMKFAEALSENGNLILAYEPGRVLVDDRAYTEGLIVTSEHIVPGWGPACAEALAAEHLEAILDLDPQVIILGTGGTQVFPDQRVYLPALQRGLGIEVMDTGAACRTYNILVSEGRKVAAGLIMC